MSDNAPQATETLFNVPTEAAAAPVESTPTATAEVATTTSSSETSQTENLNEFLSTLPEEFKAEACLKDVKDLNTLVKNYVNAQKYIGGTIKIPGENATPEEKAAFYTKLGRPETPEGYELANPFTENENLKAIAPEFDAKIQQFAGLAHELGLPKAAVKALVDYQAKELQVEVESIKASYEKEVELGRKSLKETWGDEFDAKVNLAAQMKDTFGSKYPAEMQKLLDGGAARNPLFMLMLSELGGSFKESKTKANVTQYSGEGMSEIESKIAGIKADLSNPAWDQRHPDYSKANAELNDLYRQLIGIK